MTNYEKIISKSVEELAEYLLGIDICWSCEQRYEYENDECCIICPLRQKKIDWLNKEAKV